MAQQQFFIDSSEILGGKPPTNCRTRSRTNKRAPKIFDCTTCGLDKACKSPHMKRFGKGERGVLVVGLCPGRTEDKEGRPLVGRSGQMTGRAFHENGLNLDEDCERTNIVRCYPGMDEKGHDKKPTDQQIKCCASNLQRDIEEVKPRMIICLGTEAIQSVLHSTVVSPSVSLLHGKVIPYHKLNCWVGCSYHPSYFLHKANDKDGIRDERIFTYDLAGIIGVLDVPLPKPLSKDGNKLIKNVAEAVSVLKRFSNIPEVVSFDYEASCLSPYDKDAELLTVSITNDISSAYLIPIALVDKFTGRSIFNNEEQAIVLSALRDFITSSTPKTVQNYYMEELWSRKFLGVSINNFVHDTMVSYHTLNCRVGLTNLEFQAYELTGHEYKKDINLENVKDESVNDICNFSCFDSRYGLLAHYDQKVQLKPGTGLFTFNKLFTDSLPTLANLKERGIRIDITALNEFEAEYLKKRSSFADTIRQDKIVKEFESKNGEFNPDSPPQWGKVLYDGYGIECTKEKRTPTGKNSTSDETLQLIHKETTDPQVKVLLDNLFEYRGCADVLKKINEYRSLIGPDSKIHPTFNLNTASSYRSSATGPNSQNTYKHDKERIKFRRCIIPELGQVLLEGDYCGIDVRQIAMSSGDKELIRQICDKVDTHRKWASRIYEKSPEDVISDERYEAKNGFVFPSFNGSKPSTICKRFKMPVEHIDKLQKEFWAEFKGVRDWQKRMIEFYNQHGYIEGLSGCRIPGPLTAFQIYNIPIQSTDFHLFLDALNKIDKYLIDNKFKSMIINEIHDSVLFSADPDEVGDVIEIATEIMISKRFDWQTVPLEVEWSIGPNWHEMEKV